MLADIIDLIMFPVGQFLLMLKDSRIESYLGVSVLGIAVTCMITMIVFNALISRINVGDSAASILNAKDVISKRDAAARDRAHRESYEYYEAQRQRREEYARIYKDRHSD